MPDSDASGSGIFCAGMKKLGEKNRCESESKILTLQNGSYI